MEGAHKRRWPGVLAVTAALGILLTSAGSRSMAVSSPAAAPAPPAVMAAVTAGAKARRAVPEKELPQEPVYGLVAESEAVADEYFDDAVFLGDSRTEGFYLYSGLGHGTYFYAVGATVSSVFTKAAWETPEGKIPLLDAVAGTVPGKIYMMFGVNELGWTKPDNFKEQYAEVIDRVQEDHPEAQIVLQSILPVSAKQDAKKTYVNNERIAVYNAIIETLAEEKGCFYVNAAEAVTGPDGCLPADLNFDGVHLNPAGCRLWRDYLRTHSVAPPEAPTP